MEQRTLSIDGMTCGHCVARVKKTLEAVPGLRVTEVQIGMARVDVDQEATLSAAIQAVADLGFPVRDASA